MAEIRVHANGLTRAYMEVTDERPVPHLVITCGDTQITFTPGRDIAGLSDITLATVTGAAVIARAAAEWRDRVARLGQASNGDRREVSVVSAPVPPEVDTSADSDDR